MNAPVIGAGVSPYPEPKTWDIFVGWRNQKSDRHFVGPDEQEERTEEGSQVINWMNLIDLSTTYNFSKRESMTLSIPYLMAERSNPIRDANRVVVDRSRTHSAGFSDVMLNYRRWILNPDNHNNANFSLTAGIKLPTGEQAVHDTFKVRDNSTDPATTTYVVRPVDQSIQPGDGGFGFTLGGEGFLRIGDGDVGLYLSGLYLFNPRETNELNRGGVPGSINEHLSVADQYILRFGISGAISSHFSGNLGMRLEGVPSHDVFGGDEGFRRPGYAWSVEPSLAYYFGNNAISLGVPIAVYRNRTANLNDEVNRDGQPGDAAFADYIIMVGFGHHFD